MLCSSTDQNITDLVAAAQERVVFVGPGLTEPVAQALLAVAQRLPAGRVQVCLDSDPEAIRLGYGTSAGLRLVFEASKQTGLVLNRLLNVRVGVLVSDHVTMVYTPTPLAVEAPNEERPKANAMILGAGDGVNSDELLESAKEQGVITFTKEDFDRNVKDLKERPAAKFDIARASHVFNTFYDFVELTVTGCEIARKTVPLPAELMGFARSAIGKQVQSNLRLLGDDDQAKKFDGSEIKKKRDEIEKKYFIKVPNYGCLIPKAMRAEFDKAILELEALVTKLQGDIDKGIDGQITKTRQDLQTVLAKALESNIPDSWRKVLGYNPSKPEVDQYLDRELTEIFAKGKKDIIRSMEVHVIFKGITWELLGCDRFKEQLKRTKEGRMILDKLHAETRVAPEKSK